MLNIHSSCVKYGSDSNGYVDYVKGKYCWFLKWLTLCLLKEWYLFFNTECLLPFRYSELSRRHFFGYSKTEYFGLYYICES
jgi:hypothetical protein